MQTTAIPRAMPLMWLKIHTKCNKTCKAVTFHFSHHFETTATKMEDLHAASKVCFVGGLGSSLSN